MLGGGDGGAWLQHPTAEVAKLHEHVHLPDVIAIFLELAHHSLPFHWVVVDAVEMLGEDLRFSHPARAICVVHLGPCPHSDVIDSGSLQAPRAKPQTISLGQINKMNVASTCFVLLALLSTFISILRDSAKWLFLQCPKGACETAAVVCHHPKACVA